MTSKQTSNLKSAGQLMGVASTEQATCEQHGEYEQKTHFFGRTEIKSKCPTCSKEAEEARKKAEAEEWERKKREHAQRVLERKIGASMIPKRFQDKKFSEYQTSNESQEKALEACKDYAVNFADHLEDGRCLILFGKPGTGKTHLAAAVANYLVRRTSHTAVYRSLFGILQAIKGTYGGGTEKTEREIFKLLAEPDLLIIDEIGATKSTEFELATLFALINERYEEKLPTIIISNLDAKDLGDAIGDRCLDRLREGGGKAIRFDWESMRPKLKGVLGEQ